MSKTCQETIELMNLYLDGRLSGGQYQELAKHLEGCEHCRKRMNYLRVITSELRQDRPAVPDDLHSSIMNYIAKANAPAEPRRFPLKKLQKALALCAAALVLVLVTPVAIGSLQGENGSHNVSQTDNGGFDYASWFKSLFRNITQSLSGSKEEDLLSNDGESDSASNGTGSDQDQTNSSDSISGSDQTSGSGSSGKTENAYTVPALHTRERFANYIVATGTVVDLQLYFDLSSVAVYPEDGSVYVYLSNNAGSSTQVYHCIRNMGLTLQLSPQGLPETDANAPEILFVIFPE